jgi:hypothetical protein
MSRHVIVSPQAERRAPETKPMSASKIEATKTVTYELPDLQQGDLVEALHAAFDACSMPFEGLRVTTETHLKDGTQYSREISLDELWLLCDVRSTWISVHHTQFYFYLLPYWPNVVRISVRASDPAVTKRAHDAFSAKLRLVPTTDKIAARKHFEKNPHLLHADDELAPSSLESVSSAGAIGKQITAEHASLEPRRVTAAWLWDNVPIHLWGIAIGILISVFVTGVILGQTSIA